MPTFPRPCQPVVVLLHLHQPFQVRREGVALARIILFADGRFRVDALHVGVQLRASGQFIAVAIDRSLGESTEDTLQIFVVRVLHELVEFLRDRQGHVMEWGRSQTLSGQCALIFGRDIRFVVPAEKSTDLEMRCSSTGTSHCVIPDGSEATHASTI